MRRFFIFLVLLHNICFSQGLQLLDISEEVVVSDVESSAQAQEKAQVLVLEKYVQKYGQDLVGEKKYEQNKTSIHQLIVKESGKFAPVSKSQVITSSTGQYTVLVTMKISVSNLRQIFEKAGYLSSDVESGVVLPFVSIVDQLRTKTFKWWIPDSQGDDLIRGLNREFMKAIGLSMRSAGFFVLDATEWGFQNSLPEQLQKDYFRKEDYLFLNKYFKFPLTMKGQIHVTPSLKSAQLSQLQVKLEVILNTQGRVIAETSRAVDVEGLDIKSVISKTTLFKELSDDLSDQVSVALRKGLFEASTLQIILRGHLNYKNTELFRSTLQKSLSGLRYISERSVESSQRAYDVDYSGSAEDLARKIESIKFQGVKIYMQSISNQKVEIQIEPST